MTRHVVLPADIPDLINAAQEGDTRALGRLYGFAGALTKAGWETPEPLASFVAERLAALSAALVADDLKDYRAAIVAAAVPCRRRGRRPNSTGEQVRREIDAVVAEINARGQGAGGVLREQESAADRGATSVATIRRAQGRVRRKLPPV